MAKRRYGHSGLCYWSGRLAKAGVHGRSEFSIGFDRGFLPRSIVLRNRKINSFSTPSEVLQPSEGVFITRRLAPEK